MRAFFDGLLDCEFQPIADPHILGVYLALYDSLVDDDEDIRDQGARVSSMILSVYRSEAANNGTATLSLSPPAAKKGLLRYLRDGYRTSTPLCVESVRRLTGMGSSLGSASATTRDNESQTKQGKSTLHIRPVAELFLEVQSKSTVVFVEEKQNLYIDDVSEAESWAELLSQLDLDAWPSSLAPELESWTVEGLAHIHAILESGVDGALSPTSKPEVFTLFTRVLLAVEVLKMSCGTKVSSNEIGREHKWNALLEKMLDLGRSRLFHDLLLRRMEKIVEETGQMSESRSGVVAAVES